MKLAEPVTAITDYILAAEALVFCTVLIARCDAQISIVLWAVAFALLALSSLTGGTFHGFQTVLSTGTHSSLKKITAFSILAAFGSFLASGFISTFRGLALIILLAFIPILLLTAIFWIKRNQREGFAVHSGGTILWSIFVALVLILGRQILIHGKPVGYLVLIGALFIVAGTALQQQKFAIHRQFNENDLCHVFFMIGLYFLYRGGLLFRDAIH